MCCLLAAPLSSATLQRQFDGRQHGLFVVAQDQGKDLDHLLVPAGTLQQLLLQDAQAVR